MTPTPSTRLAQIEACLRIIAEHYNVRPDRIISSTVYRGPALQDAKASLVYHLHDCGWDFNRIAKLIKRTAQRCRVYEQEGAIRMMGKDRVMIESLPRVETSIKHLATP